MIPRLKRNVLWKTVVSLWETISATEGLVGVAVFLILALSPEIGQRLQASGEYSRWAAAIPVILLLLIVVYRLESRLDELHTPKMQLLDEVDDGVWEHHFRIHVKNLSHGVVKSCSVCIVKSDPPRPECYDVPMHCKGENRPSSGRVDLQPMQIRTFDLFRRNGEKLGNLDVAAAANEHLFIKPQSYRVVLRASADNAPPVEKEFTFDVNGQFASLKVVA